MSQTHKSNDSSVSHSKKDQQSRRWMLTLSLEHYSQADIEAKLGKYQAVIGQLEEGGETGYRHWNLYVEHKSAIRFSALKRAFPKAHIDKPKKTRSQCVKYVTKADTYAGVRISLGKLDLSVKAGKRTDLESYLEQIMIEDKTPSEVVLDDVRATKYIQYLDRLQLEKDRAVWGNVFRDMKVHYLHGGTRTGKTSAVYETYGYDDVYRVSNWKNPFDGYKGQRVLVLDEYNTSLRVAELLKILEGYPLEVSARYADKVAKFTEVFIISNLRLREQHVELRQKHPEQWKAFLERLTSVSEMTLTSDDDGNPHTATLLVESGTPPKLDHFLTQKPVEFGVAEPDNRPDMPSLAVASDDSFDDFDDFGDEDADALFD